MAAGSLMETFDSLRAWGSLEYLRGCPAVLNQANYFPYMGRLNNSRLIIPKILCTILNVLVE